MSIKIMAAIWDLDLPHEQAWVLMAYADHADHDGGHCYPGTALICYKTGYSRRQIQYITGKLLERGIMTVEESGGGRGRLTHYRIDLSKAPVKAKGAISAPFAPQVAETAQSEEETAQNRAETAQSEAETAQSHTGNVREPLTVNLLTVREPQRESGHDSAAWIRIKNHLASTRNSSIAAYILPAQGWIEDETLVIIAPTNSGAEIIQQRLLFQIQRASLAVNHRKYKIDIRPPEVRSS